MSGLHAADGSLNVTVVTGNSLTGLYAADGSINVVVVSGGGLKGAYAPCGAWNVTLVTSGICGYYAADGSMNVAQSPYTSTGAVRVTAVSGSLASGAAPATPVLTLTSGAGDNTPDFTYDGSGDLVEADTVRFQYAHASDFTSASEITNTIDAAEDAANQFNFSTGSLANGLWYFRARTERTGHADSSWSNTQSITLSGGGPVQYWPFLLFA